MGSVPEGVETAKGEGTDLSSAIAAAAEELGVKRHQVKHVIDMSHFRSDLGTSVPKDTVAVIAWVNPDAPEEAPEPSRSSSKPRKSRDRDDDRGRGRDRDRDRDRGRDRDRDRGGRGRSRDRDDSGPAGEETEASTFAVGWFETVIEALGVEATVSGTGTDDRVHVRIQPEAKAGRLIGRRGSTLAAIRHLLGLALEQFGEYTVDVDVDDARDRGGKDRKSRGRDRDDRGDRKSKGRRGGKSRDRDERGGSGFPEDKLRALARRAAEKAVDSGKTITINLELNSYDRRIVHMEVSEVGGVSTRSVEKGDKKVVQVIPD